MGPSRALDPRVREGVGEPVAVGPNCGTTCATSGEKASDLTRGPAPYATSNSDGRLSSSWELVNRTRVVRAWLARRSVVVRWEGPEEGVGENCDPLDKQQACCMGPVNKVRIGEWGSLAEVCELR